MPTLTTFALQNLLQHQHFINNSSTLNNPTNQEAKKPKACWITNGSDPQLGGNGDQEMMESCLFESDNDGFADACCDSLSVGSLIDYYDAVGDFSSDESTSLVATCTSNLELELHSTRLNFHVEIEKRKAAEDDLATMFTLWHRVCKILLAPSSNDNCPTTWFDINAVKQLSEEVIVTRFVAEAIGKAEAKAEAELAAHVIIASKDKEICRLRDRMQYYEAMIHEMSQNNLEFVEVARRHRERKRKRKKWLWSCIGMSIAVGASVIAYSYAQHLYVLENVGVTQPEAVYD